MAKVVVTGTALDDQIRACLEKYGDEFRKKAKSKEIQEAYEQILIANHSLNRGTKGHTTESIPCSVCTRWVSARVKKLRTGANVKRGRKAGGKNKSNTKVSNECTQPPLKKARINEHNQHSHNQHQHNQHPHSVPHHYQSLHNLPPQTVQNGSFLFDPSQLYIPFNHSLLSTAIPSNPLLLAQNQHCFNQLQSKSLPKTLSNGHLQQNACNSFDIPSLADSKSIIPKHPLFKLPCQICKTAITKPLWCLPCSKKECSIKHVHFPCLIAFYNQKTHSFDKYCSEHWTELAGSSERRLFDQTPFETQCVGKDDNFVYFVRFNQCNPIVYHYRLPKRQIPQFTVGEQNAFDYHYEHNRSLEAGYCIKWEKPIVVELVRTKTEVQRAKLGGIRGDIATAAGPILTDSQRQGVLKAMQKFEKKIKKQRLKKKKAKEENKKYHEPAFMNGVQANSDQRTKWHTNAGYDTNDPLNMFDTDLRFEHIFKKPEHVKALEELKENIIKIAKALNVPFEQFKFLLESLDDLILVGAKYAGLGLKYHIDYNFVGLVIIYFVSIRKNDQKGQTKPSLSGKSICFGPIDSSFINTEGSLYCFWGKITDYAMHCVSRAAGWTTFALIFRQRRKKQLPRYTYPKLDKEILGLNDLDI